MNVTHLVHSCVISLLLLSTAKAEQPNKVDIYHAKQSAHQQSLSLTGTVEAKQHADLATLQSGVVAKLYVEEGDRVSKGQKLLVLDAKLAELSVVQAEAEKTAALAQKHESQRLYNEVIELSKQQLIAETLLGERLSALEISNANLGRAEAELARQQEILNRHTLYAPFSGVIAERHIHLGEWVTQQTQVVTLVEEKNLRLNVAIPQEYFNYLVGEEPVKVNITPDYRNANSFSTTLTRLVGVASQSSRTVTGLVDLPTNTNLLSGMSARADIFISNNHSDLVWLPKSAIKQHPDGGRSVFVMVNDMAKRILINVVETQGDQVAISGADASNPFVVSSVEMLRDGDLLVVNNVLEAEK